MWKDRQRIEEEGIEGEEGGGGGVLKRRSSYFRR
jgi:hypothetical protein